MIGCARAAIAPSCLGVGDNGACRLIGTIFVYDSYYHD